MSESDWGRVKKIFAEALEQDPASRDAWIERECGGDRQLQGQVEGLLLAHRDAGRGRLITFMTGDRRHAFVVALRNKR